MANDLSGSKWSIDTAMANPYRGPCNFRGGIWNTKAAVAAAQGLLVLDVNGKVLVDVPCPGPNNLVDIGRFSTPRGFQVTIITGGVLELDPHKL